MKTILIRSLSGAVYIALIIGSLLFDKSVFAFVLLCLNLLALTEFQQFNKYSQSSILSIFTGTATFIIVHLILIGVLSALWGYLFVLIVFIFNLFALFSKDEEPIQHTAFSLFGIVYITLPLILLDVVNLNSNADFSKFVLAMFIIIWTNDTFAYLSGLSFGKHKLFERISPKKTWEGFFGGLIIALITAYFLHKFLIDMPLVHWLILAALIAIAGVLGDLVESLFKRASGLKDSGTIMPGHGGILDRIDSLLFVAPILYIYLQILN